MGDGHWADDDSLIRANRFASGGHTPVARGGAVCVAPGPSPGAWIRSAVADAAGRMVRTHVADRR